MSGKRPTNKLTRRNAAAKALAGQQFAQKRVANKTKYNRKRDARAAGREI
jgi:hypothetical protein